MAATLLHTFTEFGAQVLTLTSADTAYAVTLPHGALSVSMRPRSNDARYNVNDVAMGAADNWMTLPADTTSVDDITRQAHGHPGVIYLASGTAGTKVEILPSEARS